MPHTKRILTLLAGLLLAGALIVPAASASTTQEAIIQDDAQLFSNPQNALHTLQTMREIGATRVKVSIYWDTIAPSPQATEAPSGFVASDPASYPSGAWTQLDDIVQDATQLGLQVGFQVTGPAPRWAEGAHISSQVNRNQWMPSASAYEAFVEALGTRYSGGYDGLPRVSWWSVWDEPNYGENLAPQGIDNNTVFEGAIQYRALVNAAWQGLHATGHGADTFLIGETAPRGLSGRNLPGVDGGTKPLLFLAALYCATPNGKRLTGHAAKLNGCPSSASAFTRANPGLFSASGYAQHPYAQGTPPNVPTYACGGTFCFNTKTKRSDPYYADFAELPRLESTLDRLQRLYGSHKRYAIWNTEFGYWTNPPDRKLGSLPVATAAYYMNWAEYVSYISPRIASDEQYQLIDTAGTDWTDGLLTSRGVPKATLWAYELPLYLPTTSVRRASNLTVWGAVRPTSWLDATYGTGAQAQIQFAPRGSSRYATVKTVAITSPRGYFDVHVRFSASGTVRIAWTNPASNATLYSRTQTVTVG